MRLLRALHGRMRETLQERQWRYLPYSAQLAARLRSVNGLWEEVPIERLQDRRRSDRLFILGSGPSLARISPEQWTHVGWHDSFGINFSFLLDFVPTYHILEDGKERWLREHMERVLSPRRRALAPSIWFISNRHVRRLIHPRYAPRLFPEPARVCQFRQPRRIILEADRPFRTRDFERSVVYRGTLSVVLHLGLSLGYRQFVLLGVDLHTYSHFFDGMPEMKAYVERDRAANAIRLRQESFNAFPLMVPKAGQFRRFDEYLYAVRELYLRPRGMELFVGNADNMLRPRLPLYEWISPSEGSR